VSFPQQDRLVGAPLVSLLNGLPTNLSLMASTWMPISCSRLTSVIGSVLRSVFRFISRPLCMSFWFWFSQQFIHPQFCSLSMSNLNHMALTVSTSRATDGSDGWGSSQKQQPIIHMLPPNHNCPSISMMPALGMQNLQCCPYCLCSEWPWCAPPLQYHSTHLLTWVFHGVSYFLS